MKPHILLIFIILSWTHVGFSQETREISARNADIEAQKISFITSRLALTPQEAQDFWPLYNAYRSELQALRREGKQNYNPRRQSEKEISDQDLDEAVKQQFTLDHQKINLDEKYYEKYKTVLPISKVVAFYTAERDFRRELLKTLRGKRGR